MRKRNWREYNKRLVQRGSLTFLIDPKIDIMYQIKWTPRHNCVYTVVEGMKIMEFIHAEKVEISKVLPLPSELRSQVLKFHGYEPSIVTYPREKIVIKHDHPKNNGETKE